VRRLCACVGVEEALRSASCHPGEGVEEARPDPAEPILEVNRASSSSLPASVSSFSESCRDMREAEDWPGRLVLYVPGPDSEEEGDVYVPRGASGWSSSNGSSSVKIGLLTRALPCKLISPKSILTSGSLAASALPQLARRLALLVVLSSGERDGRFGDGGREWLRCMADEAELSGSTIDSPLWSEMMGTMGRSSEHDVYIW